MITTGRSPLRACRTIEGGELPVGGAEQPQWVVRAKENFRRPSQCLAKRSIVMATMPKAAVSCQFTLRKVTCGGYGATAILPATHRPVQRTAFRVGRFFTLARLAPVSGQTFLHHHRVTYSECTLGNHIYYARYLDLIEEARGEFFRSLGHPLLGLQAGGILFPVIECHLRYKGAARYDDWLGIEVWPKELERVRVSFEYRLRNQEGRLLVEATITHACASPQDKLQRVPEALRQALASHLPPANMVQGQGQ